MRALLSALMLCFSTLVSATTLNKMVVFGDSLSDNGNLYAYMKQQVPSPPYFEGRFSNGPVWAELLVSSYFPTDSNAHLLDYAYAGAGVIDDDESLFSLRNELNSYLLAHQNAFDPNNLYVVWMGASNYLTVPSDIEQSVNEVNLGIKAGLQKLAEKGAKYVLVMNLPDLGHIPAAREYNEVSDLTMLSAQHNQQLLENVNALTKGFPLVKWLYFDVGSAFNEILTNPMANGFTNIMDTCYEASTDGLNSHSILKIAASIRVNSAHSACDGFLFFDPVHPSALAHRIISERARELLDQSGINLGL